MSGFTGYDDQINNVSALRKRFDASWTKQFNPSLAGVANEWHTLCRGGGYPQADAIFDVGANLQFQSVYDVTANAGSIQHGGNVGVNGDDFKTLMTGIANTAASTVVPGSLMIVDILGFHRVTTVTTATAQTTVNSNTFTASSLGGLLITYANDWTPFQRVVFTTTTTLPAGLALATDYWLVRVSATTANVATTYANALAGTVIAFTNAGTGTHTLTCRLPRYSSGAGVQTMIFNPSATSLGAATPQLSISYTNSLGVAGRATPTLPSLPIGKSAAGNSHILYSGGTGAGKFGPNLPLAGGDAGVRSIESITNNASYLSGSYVVAYMNIIGRIPLNVLGQDTAIDFTTGFPSFPPILDGAALYLLWKSGQGTPTNSAFDGTFTFGWK